MEAEKESTKHFVTKTGDKLIVEIEISGNPDDVLNALMKSVARDVEIFKGAKVSQIYFAGNDVESIIKSIKGKIITGVNDELLKLETELTGQEHNRDSWK
ncbi:MAG: hypothetical protein DRN27_05850 [Thermoplasmata archaeon]|nr:MAG: hypothetical protein DRN27_05850 [Thermoplasmata archaeon]